MRSSLERIAKERPDELIILNDFEPHWYQLGQLYDEKLGRIQLSETLREIFELYMSRLLLPVKFSFHKELKKLAHGYIRRDEIGRGAYCLGAAHYFWQNFVVLDKKC
ncbi:hypothetical protein HYY70_00840 [Candidatus Woesearchaeota archaeon]|nr:hypothetical protein [Candidatus Woesearchaeota archaeon]